MVQYIDKSALIAEIERLSVEKGVFYASDVLYELEEFIETFEVKEVGVDLGDPKGDKSSKYIIDTKTLEVKEVNLKSFVKIDRQLLFEICDAILNHDGYSDVNDCPENDSECFWGKWDEGFRKKVENIRRNS